MKKIILVLLVCIFLTGCFGGEEKKEEENKAFNMAQEYVLKKYNITLKESDIKNIDSNLVFSSELNHSSSYNVDIEKDGREFSVRLNTDDTIGECLIDTCKDNYERDSIIAGIESYIASRLSIPSSNVRVFTEDYMLFLNRKYSTADIILNNQQQDFKIGVLVNTDITDDMVRRLASKYPHMELYLYKMSKGTDIRKVSVDNLTFKNMSSINLENEYVCKNTCDVKKYK